MGFSVKLRRFWRNNEHVDSEHKQMKACYKDMQIAGAAGKDVYDRKPWRKMVSATVTPHMELGTAG